MTFIVAVVFAVIGIFFYTLHYEPKTVHRRVSLFQMMAQPLRDPNFRRFMLFAVYWNASVMLASPFVIPYFFEHLHMTFTQIAIWSAISSIFALFISPLWGKVADRVGHKTVLVITTFLAGSIHPLCWMLATPGHLFFIWVSGVVDAIAWGGANPAMFNLGVASTRKEDRMAYLAVLGTVTGLVGCLSGMLSAPMLKTLLPHQHTIWGFEWTGYHSLFAISALFRMQAWRLLTNVHEAHAWRARDVFRTAWDRSVGGLLK
jgi:MFS family permease